MKTVKTELAIKTAETTLKNRRRNDSRNIVYLESQHGVPDHDTIKNALSKAGFSAIKMMLTGNDKRYTAVELNDIYAWEKVVQLKSLQYGDLLHECLFIRDTVPVALGPALGLTPNTFKDLDPDYDDKSNWPRIPNSKVDVS